MDTERTDTGTTDDQGEPKVALGRERDSEPGEPFTRSRPSLTLSDAARACGVSLSRIKRLHYSPDGSAFPNAWREPGADGPDTGPWRIPVNDLIQAGLAPNRYVNQFEQGSELQTEPPPEHHNSEGQLSRVMSDRDRARAEAEKWRAVADERERTIRVLELALRQLPAAAEPPRQPLAGMGWATEADREPETSRRRWWQRR